MMHAEGMTCIMAGRSLYEQIQDYYEEPSQILNTTYEELTMANFDLGYRSDPGKDHDIHKVTRFISVSVQQVQNGSYLNLMFSNGDPVKVHLTDTDVKPYISDYIEIRYIFEGVQQVDFAREGTVTLEKDDIIMINASALHREILSDKECLFLNISIDRELFNESMLSNITLNPLQKFLRSEIMKKNEEQNYLLFKPATRNASSDINHYLRNIFREAKDQRPGYLEIAKGYLMRLIDELASDYHYNFSKDDSSIYRKKLFQAVSVYMSEHIHSVAMSDLTKVFHYQSNYFNQLIKEYAGVTYSDYLVRLRVDRARLLLETTNLSVEEILWAIGYNNKGFFNRKFREATGTTPAKYRKMKRAG